MERRVPAALVLALSIGAATAEPLRPFGIDDYFRIARFGELALSGDAQYLAYTVDRIALDRSDLHAARVIPLSGAAPPAAKLKLHDARAFAWMPYSRRLAFIASRSGGTQVYSVDVLTGAERRETSAPDPVIQFAFAPDGQSLAYTTRLTGDPATSVYSRLRAAGPGVVVDPEEVSILDLLDSTFAQAKPADAKLWIAAGGGARAINVAGDSAGFAWSANSQHLSVAYVDRHMPRHLLRSQFTSLALVDARDGAVTSLYQGRIDAGGLSGVGYLGGEWLANPERLLVRRIAYADPWVSARFPDWALIDPDRPEQAVWKPMESYSARFTARGSQILVEDTRRGVRGLAELRADGLAPSPIVAVLDGSSSLFAFDDGLRTAAFVNQGLAHPPEIYVADLRTGSAEPATTENAVLADLARPDVREVRWNGEDGVEIAGWLYEPRGEAGRPRPLLTFVHGGPSYAFTHEFAPYFAVWPYPLEVLALDGFAVFVPNYRGTQSYGRAVGSPATQDGAPADDIITGIEQLIAEGVADPERLGLAGQSHGGWLGPVVMTRLKKVRAASFAEGISNLAVAYELMPASLNRTVHDVKHGANMYDEPEEYLRQSPNLHFKGLSSANLFEGGAQSGAFFALSYGKASERAGMPTETVIYPMSGHNLASPKLLQESAERNRDWFRYWLQGVTDPNPAKSGQYERWRSMRPHW